MRSFLKQESRLIPALPKEMYRINGAKFLIKIGIFISILSAGSLLCVTQTSIALAFGIFLIAAMFAHAVELQHQCLHGGAFKNKHLNRLAGFFLGLPTLVSFSHYQFLHMEHHKYCGTPKDREFFSTGAQSVAAVFSIKRILLLYFAFSQAIENTILISGAPKSVLKSIRFEYLLLAAFVLIIGVMFCLNPILVAKLYLLPLLISEVIHNIIEFPEHFACNKQNVSPFLNTRTIASNRFAYWFTNGNNFHVEHHAYPSASVDELSAIHEMLKARHQKFDSSYQSFWLNAVQETDHQTLRMETL